MCLSPRSTAISSSKRHPTPDWSTNRKPRTQHHRGKSPRTDRGKSNWLSSRSPQKGQSLRPGSLRSRLPATPHAQALSCFQHLRALRPGSRLASIGGGRPSLLFSFVPRCCPYTCRLADSKWLCHLGSDASPRTKTGKTPPPEPASYPAWKAAAAKELKDHHGIAATAIPEHDWTRFYVLRLTPSEAPDR